MAEQMGVEAYIVDEYDSYQVRLYLFIRYPGSRTWFFHDDTGKVVEYTHKHDDGLMMPDTIKPLLRLPGHIGHEMLKAIAKAVTGKDVEIMEKVTDRSLDAHKVLTAEHSKLNDRFDKVLDVILDQIKSA